MSSEKEEIAPATGERMLDGSTPTLRSMEAEPVSPESANEKGGDDWEYDLDNPRNWPERKKWIATTIVACYAFVSPLASSMMAPGLGEIRVKFGIHSDVVVSLTLSIFLLSFALVPLVLAPVSEMYGRVYVLHLGNLALLLCNVGCALSKTTTTLLVFRFLAGIGGSASVGIGGSCISDMFSERDRASAMSLYTLGPLMGPAIGPVAGGFISQTIGVEWTFWLIAAACGVVGLIAIPFLTETYGPVVQLRKARHSVDPEATASHPMLQKEEGGKLQFLWVNLSRPMMLLTHSFVCFILSLYMAFMYGIYYLMFSVFPTLFKDIYGFGAGTGGLCYLGLGLGFLLATFVVAQVGDQIYHNLAKTNGGIGKPEMRLPGLIVGSIFVPVGLLWYGWSAQQKLHWIMPIIGTAIYGFGLMATFLPIQLYLVDSFTYAASALAAASVIRSLLGFAFPLFGKQMFHAMGYGGGNSLLAGIAILLGIPFPIWLYYNGEAMRARGTMMR